MKHNLKIPILESDSYDLPEGWIRVILPDIANINMGQSPPGSTYNETGKGLPFFQGKADFGSRYPTVRVWCTEPKKIADEGDVLISIRAPVGPTNVANRRCVIGRGLAALKPLGEIPTELLLDTLRLQEPELSKSGTGSTFTAINKKDLEQIEINLPPLTEQKRIVAKVEELLGHVNAACKRLAKVPAILKRFRQTVLAAACSGKLTEEWRGVQTNLKDADIIIDDIQQKRLSRANTDSQKSKINNIYPHEENEDSSILPDSWQYVTLEKLCESFQYGSSNKSLESGKIPVIRMGNIQNGEISWDDLKFTSDKEEIAKYSLKPNTVLFNRTNSPELVGKTGIYRGEKQAVFAGYLIRINNYPELDSRYLNYCLNTNYTKEICLKVRTDGVSQSNINAQKLAKFEIPFCALEEQKEIVRRVEELFKWADAIEKRLAAATRRAEKLTQSILAKAFRGELVPTEADLARQENRPYEPAGELLARIQAEREHKGRSDKTKRKPKARKKKINHARK